MNALVIGGLGAVALVLGYRLYGRLIERRLIRPEAGRDTPAVAMDDGLDYSPAPKMVLFGHHFASIAGAGPIVGPLLGVLYFGWVPAVLWVVIGAVFFGAVHDYTALMVSVRNQGRSLADVADHVLGRRVRWLFSAFLWITLVLIIAVFGLVTTKTLVKQPEIVIPTFGLLGVAMLFGFLVYRRGLPLAAGTVGALAALVGLVVVGEAFPVTLPAAGILGVAPNSAWFLILMAYAYLASTLPVWFLLQPRDYLSTWVLYAGLGLGVTGLMFAAPDMTAPAVTGFVHEQRGMMWPVLFITIACGAISGFHSVVASGTTSKQLDAEQSGRAIGYGGMIMEAALALLVILLAGAMLKWDPADQALGYPFLMNTKAGGPGPIGTFATAFGQAVDAIPGLTAVVGLYFGMLMLNTFVLTSLDTSTRLARFLLGEFGVGRARVLSNRWVSTALTIAAASAFGLSGSYQKIWPVFGASNQLIAALALLVVTAWLFSQKLPRLYTLIPGVLMLVTTLAALILQFKGAAFPAGDKPVDVPIAITTAVLMGLAGVIFFEARGVLRRRT
jgi:carbon starvation protein